MDINDFVYSVTLVDDNAEKSTLNFYLPNAGLGGHGLDFQEAYDDAQLIKTALQAVTGANIYKETLGQWLSGDNTLPAGPMRDITEEVVVSTYLSGAGEIPKYHSVRIPAPEEALFSALNDVDVSNADLIAYIAQLAAHTEVSDEEVIDTTVTNGIADAWWRTRARVTR